MAKINPFFQNLPKDYLFVEIQRKCEEFLRERPKERLLNLGIGDTTLPLVPQVVRALLKKVKELGSPTTYTGYGEIQGDIQLRRAICKFYEKRGIKLTEREIFVSDGAKPDCAQITHLFSQDCRVAISNPVYPVYRDANLLSGRKIIYLPAIEENNFFPSLPSEKVDLIFLCSPNNPTGTVLTKSYLKKFVDYALSQKAVIIFDAAYSEYIQDKNLPKSIYQIRGAKRCAIEIQSFSKFAGFTGVRLGWLVLPKELETEDIREKWKVNRLWAKKRAITFNGASNISQAGGLAVLSEKGEKEIREQIRYYLKNAKILRESLLKLNFKVFGGENSPYLWVKCPQGFSSFEFFEFLLKETKIVCVPGSGFGEYGEGFVRFSAFPKRKVIEKAISSLIKKFKKI